MQHFAQLVRALRASRTNLSAAEFAEAVNDHQVDNAARFEAAGYILVANDTDELLARYRRLDDFHPTKRECRADSLSHRIAEFLGSLTSNH